MTARISPQLRRILHDPEFAQQLHRIMDTPSHEGDITLSDGTVYHIAPARNRRVRVTCPLPPRKPSLFRRLLKRLQLFR